jgi:hypothetical protein
MSNFELIEVEFSPDDFSTSLEDEFLLARISNELKAVTDIEQLRVGALKLLELAVHRQAVIRGLVRRIADVEGQAIKRYYED